MNNLQTLNLSTDQAIVSYQSLVTSFLCAYPFILLFSLIAAYYFMKIIEVSIQSKSALFFVTFLFFIFCAYVGHHYLLFSLLINY